MRRAASLQRSSILRLWVAGGGIFAKTAKTPPLQSALRGDRCDVGLRPTFTPCGHQQEWRMGGNDAARRVATSSEERENQM